MSIDISSRFNYGRLFRFVLPSVVMMIFISTYTMVDGFFVSNYVGKTAFTAVNLIFSRHHGFRLCRIHVRLRRQRPCGKDHG